MADSSILIIYNARLVDSCIDSPGILIIKGGKICGIYLGECKSTKKALLYSSAFLADCPEDTNPDFYDAKGLTLMPGFIDMHVHFRYPGQTQKEDLDSGLHAAVAGGYTTVVLMPNTTPVISDRELAQKVMDEANGKNLARVFQTVSITKNFQKPGTVREILGKRNRFN